MKPVRKPPEVLNNKNVLNRGGYSMGALVQYDTQDRVITLAPGEQIKLTIPGSEGRTCVYVTNTNGKLEFIGGSSIVETANTTCPMCVLLDSAPDPDEKVNEDDEDEQINPKVPSCFGNYEGTHKCITCYEHYACIEEINK